MSKLYNTKALGRTWVPPTSLPPSSLRYQFPGRYESRPLETCYEATGTRWPCESRAILVRKRGWEKIVLALFLTAVMCAFAVLQRTSSDRGTFLGPEAWSRRVGGIVRWDGFNPPLPGGMWRQEASGQEGEKAAFEVEGLGEVTWSDFAYVTYASRPEEFCGCVMVLEALKRLGAKAERVLIYAGHWDADAYQRRVLASARDVYGARLVPVEIDSDWAADDMRLLAFNQTRYKRVLALDAGATVQHPMDELFLLPSSILGSSGVAMPRAYWLSQRPDNDVPSGLQLSSDMLLLSPSTASFEELLSAQASGSQENRGEEGFITDLYKETSMVLPHNPYLLSTSELRSKNHSTYSGAEAQDIDEAVASAKYVRFEKPEPWERDAEWNVVWPGCENAVAGGTQEVMGCKERSIWEDLYRDWRMRQKKVCGVSEADVDAELARMLAAWSD